MTILEKFDTQGLAPADRLPFWNDLIDRVYVGTWVNASAAAFSAEMWHWRVGELNMIRPRSKKAQVGRGADDQDKIVLHLQRSGHSRYRHGRHETELQPGDFVLFSTSQPYVIDLTAHEMLVVQFPRHLIENKLHRLDDRLGMRISGANAGGRVFHEFLLSLWHQGDQSHADPDWQSGIAGVFGDLVALAVNAASDRASSTAPNRLRERVLSLVEARLGDPDLRTATIADGLGISARTVQNVFAAMGKTPVGYVVERRLARAAELLICDPAMSVTTIALDLGFNDSAYFSRCFRQHFGTTPSGYRTGS